MKKYSNELSVGIFVFIGLLCVAYLTIKLGKMELFSNEGYMLTARFESVSGLRTGASVEIAGVAVGKVTSIKLDTKRNFYAVIEMRIQNEIELTDDTIASIKTSGLIGDKYISISPGGSDTILKDGDEITETLPVLDIESLISKFVFGGVDKK